MVNRVGHLGIAVELEINEAFGRTRVGELAVSRKDREREWTCRLVDQATGSIEIRREWIGDPEGA
jgi:hypothetical protein